jgi:fatty acid desaturase
MRAVVIRHSGDLEAAIRAIPAEWFRPSPLVYWCDLLASATIGWVAFISAVMARGMLRILLLTLAAAVLYRAVVFIHEITHLAPHDVPLFVVVWNTIVGVPLLMPSFLYERIHTDHHRQRCYGTAADPEYMPYGRRRPMLMAVSLAASALAPVAFFVRFALLGPLGWIVPPVGRVVRERASALAINPEYVRRAPYGPTARLQEAAAAAFAWTSVGLWWRGTLPTAAIACWALAMSAASLVNAVRTLASHNYDHEGGEMTMLEQLLDSRTIGARDLRARAIDALHVVVAPLGLRYHALHHWIPALPYHNLGRAHRCLLDALDPDAPYCATIVPGLTPAIRDLVARSRAQF